VESESRGLQSSFNLMLRGVQAVVLGERHGDSCVKFRQSDYHVTLNFEDVLMNCIDPVTQYAFLPQPDWFARGP